MNLQPGQMIDGQFRITQVGLGRGGHGEVHLAEDLQGRKVVLKFPFLQQLHKDLALFKREYQNLLRFSHPNVAQAFHFGEHGGNFFIASEFVAGEPFHKVAPSLAIPDLLKLFIQGLEGLEAIHTERMLHLDIKSGNVLVAGDSRVKIIDFGLMTALEELQPKKICGTPSYLPPEMVLDGKKLDARADLFSFGVLMYLAVAGSYPFPKRREAQGSLAALKKLMGHEHRPKVPSHSNPQCPKYLDEIILTLLARDPADRYATARAVINAIKTHQPQIYKESPEAKGSYLVPENNRHIGREREQKILREAVTELAKGKQPGEAMITIAGGGGVGKSHLLKTVKAFAEKSVERLAIHYIEFPRGVTGISNSWIQEWLLHLNRDLLENAKPILVLVDNMEGVGVRLSFGTDPSVNSGTKVSDSYATGFTNLIEMLKHRQSHPQLFTESRPILMMMAGRDLSDPMLTLQPFTQTEVRDYLAATPALRGKKIPKPMIESLYHRTAGNPRELREHLIQCDSQGVLFDLDGNISLAQATVKDLELSTETSIPNTTQERFSAAWQKLNPFEQDLLGLLSVWQEWNLLKPCRLRDLQKLCGDVRLLSALQGLVREGMLESKSGYAFTPYSYLPEWILQQSSGAVRKQWHANIAAHLSAGDGYQYHFGIGHDGPPAIRALFALAKKRLYQNGEVAFAQSLYKEALQRGASLNDKLKVFLLGQLANAYCLGGEYEKAMETFDQGTMLVKAGHSFPKILAVRLVISAMPALVEKGDFKKAEAMIRQYLASGNGFAESYLGLILRNFQGTILYKRFYLEAKADRSLLQKAVTTCKATQRAETKLHPHQGDLVRNNNLGFIFRALGRDREAIRELKSKLGKLKKSPNIFLEFVVIAALAEAYRILGKFPEGLEYADEALKLARRTNNAKWLSYAHQIKGAIHQHMALSFKAHRKEKSARIEFKKALQEMTCRMGAATFLNSTKEKISVDVNLLISRGQCLKDLGKWNEAYVHFKAALDYKLTGIFLPVAYVGLAECLLQKSRRQESKKYLDMARPLLAKLPAYISQPYQFKALEIQARCLLKDGKGERIIKAQKEMKILSRSDPYLQAEFNSFRKILKKEPRTV